MDQIRNLLEYAKCPICENNEYKVVGKAKDFYNNFAGEFEITKCNNCGFIYTNPRPTEENVHLLYPDNAGYLTPKKIDEVSLKNKRILAKKFGYKHLFNKPIPYSFFNLHKARNLRIQSFPDFIVNGSFLDIGASYGDFLYKIKSLGWNCKGIELNPNSASYAVNELNLDVKQQLIEDYPETETFDVVHMGMVLEHIISPTEVLKKVNKLLKPNGTFIFSVPNIGSFEGKLFGRYWYSLHLPMHLNHFTRNSIKKLLIENGYNDIKIFHQSDPNDIIMSLKYLSFDYKIFYPLYKLLSFKVIRKLIIKPIMVFLAYLNLTSRITIYTKKH